MGVHDHEVREINSIICVLILFISIEGFDFGFVLVAARPGLFVNTMSNHLNVDKLNFA